MTNEEREQVALFRYGVIAPLLNHQVASTQNYLSEICAKTHDVPYYGRKEFAPKTVLGWLRSYRSGGFLTLKPKGRSDKGECRVLTPELKDRVIALRQKHRQLSATLFYETLISEGVLTPNDSSYHSIYRLLRSQHLLERDGKPCEERKRFAYDKVNVLWQGDMSVGYYLVIGGKKYRTNLFAFLDDCSRLIPFAQFFFSEKFDSMKTVLKEALTRRGIPRMIYVDNGKVYQAGQLQLACASLGITLTPNTPYDPQSKGKIERFFGTVRRRFYPMLDANPPKSLDELNSRFWHWLEEDYHRKTHSAIDMCPLDLFMSQVSSVRMVNNPAILDSLFFRREYRKVRQDATITLLNRLFEVPAIYTGQKIEIRYDPAAPEVVHIYEHDKSVYMTKAVSLSDNAHVKRHRNNKEPDQLTIDFKDLLSCQQEGN